MVTFTSGHLGTFPVICQGDAALWVGAQTLPKAALHPCSGTAQFKRELFWSKRNGYPLDSTSAMYHAVCVPTSGKAEPEGCRGLG